MAGRIRVGLVGYYGWGNYGDELFHQVLAQQLPDIEWVLLHDVDAEGRFLDGELRARLATVDAVMIGGGDLVIPYAMSGLYWREEFLAKPVVVYGVGVPRWGGYDDGVVAHLRRFFQHASVQSVTARDEQSAQWIRTHIKPSAPVDCEPDIACVYQRPVPAQRSGIGIVFRHQGNGLNVAGVSAVLDAVRARGETARLIVLGSGKTRVDDLATTLTALGNDDADIVLRTPLDDLTDVLVGCRKAVSMKFHGCVVAMAHDVPCLALSAADKFKNFYAELERPEWVTTLASEDLAQKLAQFLDGPDYLFPDAIRQRGQAALAGLDRRLRGLAAG